MSWRDVDRWLVQADTMRQQGNHDGAIDALRRVLGQDPDHAVAHGLLALSLLAKRRVYAARHEAQSALMLDPDEPLSHCAMGAVAMAQRELDLAAQHLDLLLALEPEAPLNHRLMAELHELRDRPDDARAALETALELDPDDPDTLVALAELAMDRGDWAEAAEHAAEALGVDPEHADAHVVRGRLDLRAGDVAAAREHAVFALRQDPEHLAALYLLAGVKARQSWFLGLWWRFASRMDGLGEAKTIAVLVGTFALYQLSFIVAEELGAAALAMAMRAVWLAFCAYTWFGPAAFRRSVDRELGEVVLSEDY